MTTIAVSKSGLTRIFLSNDNFVVLSKRKDYKLCTLGQLKWMLEQDNFKGLSFFTKIQAEVLDGVTAEPVSVTDLPLVQFGLNISEKNVAIIPIRQIGDMFLVEYPDGNKVVSEFAIAQDTTHQVPAGVNLNEFVDREKTAMAAKKVKAEKIQQEWLAEMHEPCKGWYVVTLEVLVSKMKGNDGPKCYSFRVLAENKMDAYNRAVNVVREEGVKDRNVDFVYHVTDSAASALIEFVGVWTDEAVMEYGDDK